MVDVSHYGNIKAIHIIKDKQTIFEYIRDDEMVTSLFSVGCIFKSFLSVLVGVAIYEGKINSIEDCIIDYVSQEEIMDVNWYKLKIKHALSKTTGIKWPRPQEPIPAHMSEIMELNFESTPGISFQYKPDSQIIVYLLEEIYDLDITELFETKIIAHFTNKNYEWNRNDIQGMKVSIPLLNELGELLLNKGTINGIRLFSEDYYEQMIKEYSSGGFPECLPYGLGWWTENKSNILRLSACGFGGQKLVIIPQKEMTITILSDMDRPHPENTNIIEIALQL